MHINKVDTLFEFDYLLANKNLLITFVLLPQRKCSRKKPQQLLNTEKIKCLQIFCTFCCIQQKSAKEICP